MGPLPRWAQSRKARSSASDRVHRSPSRVPIGEYVEPVARYLVRGRSCSERVRESLWLAIVVAWNDQQRDGVGFSADGWLDALQCTADFRRDRTQRLCGVGRGSVIQDIAHQGQCVESAAIAGVLDCAAQQFQPHPTGPAGGDGVSVPYSQRHMGIRDDQQS